MTWVTPAALLMDRSLQTHFHQLYSSQQEGVEKHLAWQKCDHDNHAKRRIIKPGDCVFAQNSSAQGVTNGWQAASFQVALDGNNMVWRRHIDHIQSHVGNVPHEPELPVDTQGGV